MTMMDFLLGWWLLLIYLASPIVVIPILGISALTSFMYVGKGLRDHNFKQASLGVGGALLVAIAGWLSALLFAPTKGQGPTLTIASPKVQVASAPPWVFLMKNYSEVDSLIFADGPTIYVQVRGSDPSSGYQKVIFNNSSECRKAYASPMRNIEKFVPCYKLDKSILYNIPNNVYFSMEKNTKHYKNTMDTKFYIISNGYKELIASIHAEGPRGGHPFWPNDLSIYKEFALIERQTAYSLMEMVEVRTKIIGKVSGAL